ADVKFTDGGSFGYATTTGASNSVLLNPGGANNTTLQVDVTAPSSNTATFTVRLGISTTNGTPSTLLGSGLNQINVQSFFDESFTTPPAQTKSFVPLTVIVGSNVAPGTYHFNATAAVQSITSGSVGNGINGGNGWSFDVVVTNAAFTTLTVTPAS